MAAIAALAVGGGCGGDDEPTSGDSGDSSGEAANVALDESGAREAAEATEGRAKEIADCIEANGSKTQTTPAGEGGENLTSSGSGQLIVVDSGETGEVYVFPDDAAADQGEPALTDYYEGLPGYEFATRDDTVLVYRSQGAAADLEACVSG